MEKYTMPNTEEVIEPRVRNSILKKYYMYIGIAEHECVVWYLNEVLRLIDKLSEVDLNDPAERYDDAETIYGHMKPIVEQLGDHHPECDKYLKAIDTFRSEYMAQYDGKRQCYATYITLGEATKTIRAWLLDYIPFCKYLVGDFNADSYVHHDSKTYRV